MDVSDDCSLSTHVEFGVGGEDLKMLIPIMSPIVPPIVNIIRGMTINPGFVSLWNISIPNGIGSDIIPAIVVESIVK